MHRATWTEHHVRAEAHRQLRCHPTMDRDTLVETVVAAACHPDRAVRVETPRLMADPFELQQANGESVFVEHASARYTTLALLDAEERIVIAARQPSQYRSMVLRQLQVTVEWQQTEWLDYAACRRTGEATRSTCTACPVRAQCQLDRLVDGRGLG